MITPLLILEKPGLISWILHAYGRFAWFYGMIAGGVGHADRLPCPVASTTVAYIFSRN